MKVPNRMLALVATALETAAGASTSANATEEGYWKRIAAAIETGAGTSSTANSNLAGYMRRAAVAAESVWGGSGAEENSTDYDGLLKRIVDAMELDAGSSSGSLPQRFAAAGVLAAFVDFSLQAGNKVTNPDAFDNASWTKTNISVVADDEAAPGGLTALDRLVPNTGTGTHTIASNVFGIFNNDPLTLWVFFKADGYSRVALRESAGGGYASYDLANGTVLDSGNGGIMTIANSAIQPAGGGLYKCSFRMTPNGAGGAAINVYVLPVSYTAGQPNDTGWAGNGADGVLASRLQVFYE